MVLAKNILVNIADNFACLYVRLNLLHVEDEAAATLVAPDQVAHLFVDVEVGGRGAHFVCSLGQLALFEIVAGLHGFVEHRWATYFLLLVLLQVDNGSRYLDQNRLALFGSVHSAFKLRSLYVFEEV